MAIRPNRFNDPALGEAFSNLASIFAPPSAQDVLGYTTAKAKREDAERLAWLFANPTDPTASKRSSLVGVQGYGQTPEGFTYQVDQNNATTRRGQDVSAATDLERQRIAGRFGLAGQFMTPLNPGQVQPGLPGSVAGAFGVPEMPRVEGLPKPMTMDELNARTLMGMPQEAREAVAFGNTPIEEILQGDETVFATRPGAIGRAVPPPAAGSAAKPENATAILPDGSQVPAIQDVTTGRWRHAQTGAELPADVRVVKMAAPTGSNEQLGLGKPAQNMIDRQLIDVAVAKDTAVKLRELVASSPASQGMVGWLRGTAQNVIQTGGELGSYFGGGVQQVTDAITSGAADASLAGAFDPNIPAIEMLANLLAFQYAKTTTGERLSNEMLAQARRALGLVGLTANQASSLTRIDMAIKQMESQERILLDAKRRGVDALGQPAPPAPAQTPVVTAPPGGAGVLTPDDLKYLEMP